MNLDREQLETLKRQIEEDYRLDMAAVDRLLRLCAKGGNSRHRSARSDPNGALSS